MKKLPKKMKLFLQTLPLVGVIVTSFLPSFQRSGQQMLMLIVLLWVQVYFITASFIIGK